MASQNSQFLCHPRVCGFQFVSFWSGSVLTPDAHVRSDNFGFRLCDDFRAESGLNDAFIWSDAVDVQHEVFDMRRRVEADSLVLFSVSKRDLYAKMVCMIRGCLAGASVGENAASVLISLIRTWLHGVKCCVSLMSAAKERYVFWISSTTKKAFVFSPGMY